MSSLRALFGCYVMMMIMMMMMMMAGDRNDHSND